MYILHSQAFEIFVSTKIEPLGVAIFVLQHYHMKNILRNRYFNYFWKFIMPIPRFQGPRPKFKYFPVRGIFFPNSRTFQDFQIKSTWYTLNVLRIAQSDQE